MSSRRALKAAQAIREVVSTAILLQIKDPRVADVTVTLVEVSGDLRAAKVYVSVMGDPTKQDLCLKGLQSSTGFLQKKVGNRIDTRYIPRLTFVLDKGAQNAMEVTRILNEVLPAERQEAESAETTETVPAETESHESDAVETVTVAVEPEIETSSGLKDQAHTEVEIEEAEIEEAELETPESSEPNKPSPWPAKPPGPKGRPSSSGQPGT